MNGKGSSALKIGLSALVLIFLIYQIFSMVYKPITTATAVYYETYSGIEINGFFVKEETPIDYKVTGTERYIANAGEKVAKGGTIAEVYSSADVAAAYEKADDLEEQIRILESINSVTDPSSVDLNTLSNRITRAYMDLMNSTDLGEYSALDEKLSQLLIHLNRKQMITGEVLGFDNLLASLKAELATLKSGLTAPASRVVAEKSGYFVPQTDGLETTLTFDMVDSVTEETFNDLVKTQNSSGFGKIVSAQNFYIIAKMQGDDYLNFSVGKTIKLKTSIIGAEEIKATVHKINVSESQNTAVIIFSCANMNGQIALSRSAPMTIVTEEYSGIRVSKNAVRVVDGATGVYIIQGSSVKFRPIEIIYSTDTFAVCKQSEDGNSKTLRLYDEIIEKGKNLYDGKYIG